MPHGPWSIKPRTRRPGVATKFAAQALPCLWIAVRAGTMFLVVAGLVVAVLMVSVLALYRDVNPPRSMLMWTRMITGQPVAQHWLPLRQISPHLVHAVVLAEDNQFCRHRGLDLKELRTAIKRLQQVGVDAARGGSTITMQVVKNMFLWSHKSYLRKAIELPMALAMEQIWTKRRILEVYLNVAEWGPGIFGAGAAARHHFRTTARHLSPLQAALLAASLPNPKVRIAGRPSAQLRRVARVIKRRARQFRSRAHCAFAS